MIMHWIETNKYHHGQICIFLSHTKMLFILIYYCQIIPIMVTYVPTWFLMVPYGHIWSNMVIYGPLYSQLFLYGAIWSSMAPLGPVWSHMILYDPSWCSLVKFGPKCSFKSLMASNSRRYWKLCVLVCVEKDFALKLGGHRKSWVVIFGQGPASEGQNGGTL